MSKRFNTREFETMVIAHAWKDKEFKKRLLSNPKAALKELGYDVSNLGNINIKLEEPNSLTLILPPEPSNVNELSEEELRQVAGAGGPTCFVRATC